MCDPVSAILGGVQAGGSLLSGFLGSKSHNAAADLEAANSRVLATEGQIAAGKADLATVRGNYDEFLTRRKVSQVEASETTGTVAGVADPTWGSPLVMQAYTAAQGETDAGMIRARAAGERADALSNAANVYSASAGQALKASADRAAGIVSMVSGITGAGSAFLNSASRWKMLGAGGGGGGGYGINTGNPFGLS